MYPTIKIARVDYNHSRLNNADLYLGFYNVLRTNTRLKTLTINDHEWHTDNRYYGYLQPFLLMNRLGRQQLLEPDSSIVDWHQMLIELAEYPDAVFYLLTKKTRYCCIIERVALVVVSYMWLHTVLTN
jgi:hypothetical protein